MGRVDRRNSGHVETESSAAPVDLVWSHSDIGVYTEPVFTEDRLFYVDRERELVGVDLQTGTELWSVPDGNAFYPIAIDEQHVYNHAIATETPFVARDSETGERRWAADIGALTAPKLYDDSVYVVETRTGRLVRFDAESGDVRWEYELAGSTAQLAVSEDGISGISNGGSVEFVDHGGDGLWERSLDRGPVAHAQHADLVLFSTRDGTLVALDRATGDARWQYDTESEAIVSNPTTVNDRVHVLDRDGVVHAVTVDGDAVWTWDTDTDGDGWNGELFNYEINATNNWLYVLGFDEHVHVLDADTESIDAESRWDVGTVTSPPAVAGDVAFLQSGGDSIRAFELE
ncbi:outer membrane protein assembly factor BamB family protein [Natronorubrum texcoconense]|uniref:Outer membrane protein assembly factor BamB, contains PQQ-like beta-propeller repeat n=1 Tax=Natronorubrum texcoconense TaxID=1095776 RepID=A0A1G9EPW6_9EURY|nr:PQQ-binding-like beta-propeller repeat protein [Natronorubrum texcoconense]SDK78170.1 Outer membrane protein assembly factor BamB, contains PQQ-like beta-propeller repeat [Natronorubrum texcoconense]